MTEHPTKLTVRKDRKSLSIEFGDAESYELSAEILRVLSPSAEVQGHSPEQRKTIGGKKDVGIMQMEAGLDTGPVLLRQAMPLAICRMFMSLIGTDKIKNGTFRLI